MRFLQKLKEMNYCDRPYKFGFKGKAGGLESHSASVKYETSARLLTVTPGYGSDLSIVSENSVLLKVTDNLVCWVIGSFQVYLNYYLSIVGYLPRTASLR